MERVAFDVESGDLLVGDFVTRRIEVGIDLSTYLQSCASTSRGDEIDNHLMADQRLASPVSTDEGKQSVLNLGGVLVFAVGSEPSHASSAAGPAPHQVSGGNSTE